MMEDCRFGTMCWRLLCTNVHACGRKRARWWAELWSFAMQEDAAEHIVDVPVPKIHEELVDIAQIIPQERICCMFEEPQVAAKLLEVIEAPEVAGVSWRSWVFSVQSK